MSEAVSRPRRYFIFHFLLLRFLGLGWWHQPEEGDTRNFPGWYIYYTIVTQTVWVAGFVGLETIDPFVGEKEMDRFMFSLSFVITHNLTVIKLYLFIFRNKEIQEVVRILQLDLYEFYQNNKTNRTTIKITRIFTFMFISFGWITIGNSNVYGAIQDIHWKSLVKNLNDTSLKPSRSLPQPIYIPWNYQEDKFFIPTFLLETIGLLWTGHIVMGIDTFIGSVILHMSSQFKILGEALVTAYDRTMAQLREGVSYDSEENVLDLSSLLVDEIENNEKIVKAFYTEKQIESSLQTTLRNCVRQHQILIGDMRGNVWFARKNPSISCTSLVEEHPCTKYWLDMTNCNITGLRPQYCHRCVDKFATTYSYGFMTQLLSSMAAICVVMVQVSQDASSLKSVRLVTSMAFFLAMITQLGIQCFTGNELTLQAARISDAVMQCKWERMPARLRPLLLMMMMRSQRPLRLNAAGFAFMDNDCFLSIMKAAYSYYAVLSQKQV